MLDGFIKKFVLCPECENPETELVSVFEGFVNKKKSCLSAFVIIGAVMSPNSVPWKTEQT